MTTQILTLTKILFQAQGFKKNKHWNNGTSAKAFPVHKFANFTNTF